MKIMRKVSSAVLVMILFSTLLAAGEDEPATIEIQFKKWTGDLDGMVERRIIRVLVAYNKTNYFVDKDTQRGIAYDAMKLFETELNKKLNVGKLGLHVLFIPVS